MVFSFPGLDDVQLRPRQRYFFRAVYIKVVLRDVLLVAVCQVKKRPYNDVHAPGALCLDEDDEMSFYLEAQVIIDVIHEHVADCDVLKVFQRCFCVLWMQRLVKGKQVFRHAEQVGKHAVLDGTLGWLPSRLFGLCPVFPSGSLFLVPSIVLVVFCCVLTGLFSCVLTSAFFFVSFVFLDLCQYLGHKKLNFFSLPNRQGDIVLSCKSLILNLLWCLVSKGTVTPFSVVK